MTHKEVAGTAVYDGTWTRRPGTDIFDAVWGSVNLRDVIAIESVNGNQITLKRQSNGGHYHGTLSADGSHVTNGTATWFSPGWSWSATVVDKNPTSGPTAFLAGTWDTTIRGSVHVIIQFSGSNGSWAGKFFGFKGWENMADLKVDSATGAISWRRPLAWCGESDQHYSAHVQGKTMTGEGGGWSATRIK